MKLSLKIFAFCALLFFISCGENEKKENTNTAETTENVKDNKAVSSDPMKNKGIGPVKSLSLDDNIDETMAQSGAELFNKMCSACHKMDKKFVGPAMDGVTERRTPEWIMNMILNPENMLREDPIAKELLIESNMAMMANQNLTEDEARIILEYFRKYDEEN